MKFKIKKKDEFDEFDLPYIPKEWKLDPFDEECLLYPHRNILHCQFICENGEYYYADFISKIEINVNLGAFLTVNLWAFEGLAQKIEGEKITQIKGIFRVNKYVRVLLLTVEFVYRKGDIVCFNVKNVERTPGEDRDVSIGAKPYEIDYEPDENTEIKTNSIYDVMMVIPMVAIPILLIAIIIAILMG